MGDLLASSGWDNAIRVWDPTRERVFISCAILILKAHCSFGWPGVPMGSGSPVNSARNPGVECQGTRLQVIERTKPMPPTSHRLEPRRHQAAMWGQ